MTSTYTPQAQKHSYSHAFNKIQTKQDRLLVNQFRTEERILGGRYKIRHQGLLTRQLNPIPFYSQLIYRVSANCQLLGFNLYIMFNSPSIVSVLASLTNSCFTSTVLPVQGHFSNLGNFNIPVTVTWMCIVSKRRSYKKSVWFHSAGPRFPETRADFPPLW